MDKASIHSAQINTAPCINTRKTDIIAWLSSNGIPQNSSSMRAELLLLVNANKPTYRTFEIDTISMQYGHRVVRLPQYHCHYNTFNWCEAK